MTKSVLSSAIIAIAALFVANTASAQDLQCAMLASAGQPLPPYCAKQAAPAASQATTPAPTKATNKTSTTSTEAQPSKAATPVEMKRVASTGQAPKATKPTAKPVTTETTTQASASNRVGAPKVEIVTTTIEADVVVERPASQLSLSQQNKTKRPRLLSTR